MFFTLAVSARTADACGSLVNRAVNADPRVMPVPGPARLAWRSADCTAAVVAWGSSAAGPAGPTAARAESAGGEGAGAESAASHAGTIRPAGAGPEICARTSITRIDPVYLAELPTAVILSDRASWAAAVAERLSAVDPAAVSAIVNMGFPLGGATPFPGVRALGAGTRIRAAAGRIAETSRAGPPAEARGLSAAAAEVASALVAAVAPVRDRADPVDLSLTGGKDSRLIAAVLHAAGVPFRARTYGFPGHPDVVVAGLAARRLGVGHVVTQPRVTPGRGPAAREAVAGDGPAGSTDSPAAVQRVDVLARLRSAVLVADGMLSAFENLGKPDPDPATAPSVGGQGGELLRGGYARITAARIALGLLPPHQMTPLAALSRHAVAACHETAASAVLLQRLALPRSQLLRTGPRLAYLAELAPWFGAVGRDPHRALDDFYLVNRAGRWSAAARQAYAIAAPVVQPLFDDAVVRAARSAPLRDRLNDRLIYAVIGELCPSLLDVPLAGGRWKFDAVAPASAGPERDAWLARAPVTMPRGQPHGRASFDWRRRYGNEVAQFLRGYVLDQGPASALFGVVSRRAAERALRVPHADPAAAWALATLAALASGDWLSAREGAGRAFDVPVPS